MYRIKHIMSAPMDIISEELNYSATNVSHSTPSYSKVQSISNVTSFTPSLNSSVGPYSFLLANRPQCLGKHRLQFDVLIPAQGASKYSWVTANTLNFLDRVVLTSQTTNQVLFDCSNFSRYANTLNPVCETFVELQSKSNYLGSTSGAIPILNTSVANAQTQRVENISRSNSSINPDGVGLDMGDSYFSVRKYFVSTAVNVDNAISVSIPLNNIDYSIFDLDQVLYFGENLLIDFYFSPMNKCVFASDKNDGSNATRSATSGIYTISGLQMITYYEQNNDVVQSLVNKVQTTGMSINFPYPYISRYNLTGTSHSATINLSRSYGHSILFIALAPYNGTESDNTALDHNLKNLWGASGNFTALNFNTYMNSVPITSSANVDIFQSDHWTYQRYNLKGSCIQGYGDYNQNFAWIDNFMGGPLCTSSRTASDGYPLGTSSQYQFQVNGTGSGATLNYYVIIVAQKTLFIGPNGLQIS